jgi:hypothetical protein
MNQNTSPMTRSTSVARHFLATAVFGIAMTAMALDPARAACDFTAVKQEIDVVLDRDAARAAKFRHEVVTGSDSIAVLESLVSPEMAKKIDICRFETAEYLTKRGFPPFH